MVVLTIRLRATAAMPSCHYLRYVAVLCGVWTMNVFIHRGERHVLVGLTLVVILFAKQTWVTESRNTTKAARDTASVLEALLTVARDTATSSESAAVAARERVSAAAAARAADERDRKAHRLRHTAELIEQIFEKGSGPQMGAPGRPGHEFEQGELPPLLVSTELPLPKCY